MRLIPLLRRVTARAMEIAAEAWPAASLYVVVGEVQHTILPWSGRPRDRPPGSVCRSSTRYDKPCNCRYF